MTIDKNDFIYKIYPSSKCKLYRVHCNNCGVDRGYLFPNQDKRPNCNKCSGIGNFSIDMTNFPSNCDPNDWIKNKDNIRLFKTSCVKCGNDRGYKRHIVANELCKECASIEIGKKKTGQPSPKKGIKTGVPAWNRGEFFGQDKKIVKNRMSRRLRHALNKRHIEKKNSTLEILGYSIQQLVEHLESKFEDGMTWSNAGRQEGVRCWHIDHIIPDAAFNYTSFEDEEFKKCWALDNLQPLWEEDNLQKSSKLNWSKK
jgi:hypothetical protein